ncbi:hypothetical protein LVD17_06045 [Fulvivirga ulvae]|uniref:hypothetical protein n=1 Tax=Fulvivirga ulvae TaxID=2904245 RepID=UPI001F364522|nr:hypothetical protein [Fulvivirga ulvae]UII33381.1 hypothetical protein LVD17_06045 [Fulvivirga ulvae]
MELKDFVVTPIVLFIVYILAYIVRPKVTDHNTRRYFIPALTVKIIGAIALGLIYQFYYGFGDTFWYHTYGSQIIWKVFWENPIDALRIIFGDNVFVPDLYVYTSRIRYFEDADTFFIVRLAAIFDIFTFGSYAATSVLFAVAGFTGLWAMYQVFYYRFANLYNYLALSILFVPSVVFWGSGILKDTITISALGWLLYAFDKLIILKRGKPLLLIIVSIIAIYLLFVVKKYILFTFVPSAMAWLYVSRIKKLSNVFIKILIAPVLLALVILIAVFSINKIGEHDEKYAIDNLAKTAQITAYDIAYQTGKDAGSTYTLGELDGTYISLFKLFPQAINVTLFRPYIWEVRNPFMLLASVESTIILFLTITVIFKRYWIGIINQKIDTIVLFSIIFSVSFAFAVGVSTFNFGTLMRYKIPLMPFYLSSLVVLIKSHNK